MLDPNERTHLTDVIAGLSAFTDEGVRGRRVLLQQANLGRFTRMDLSGSSDIAAAYILGKLEEFGPLPENPTYHAVGALLSYVMRRPEVSSDDQKFLARLIVRYSLVGDGKYLADLRREYGIDEAAVRQPAPQGAAPAEPPAPPLAPAFQPALADEAGLEQVINSDDNFLDIDLLAGAVYSAQAVCRIEAPEKTAVGTGFLVGPDLLLTNKHVLRTVAHLEVAVARFDYWEDASGVARAGRLFHFQQGTYHCSDPEELDYALVRLEGKPLEALAGDASVDELPVLELIRRGRHRGYLSLSSRTILENERVNIIQHAGGDPLKAVLTQNRVAADMSDTRVQYVADTKDGSSGSPVFDLHWNVVALHHSGTPYPPQAAGDAVKRYWKGKFRVNEGIPMKAIVKDFEAKGILSLLPRS